MLTLIGLGLHDGKDISVRGLEIVRNANEVFIEGYTSLLQCSHEELESQLGRKITVLARIDVERKIDSIIERAKNEEIAILIIGDVFGATTHTDLFLRAAEAKIETRVVHNASIINAVGVVGLELYRFGKVVSIPYWLQSFEPTSFLTGIKENHDRGLHTLALLDIKADENRFMSVNEGIEHLKLAEKKLALDFVKDDLFVIGAARIGCPDVKIFSGKLSEVVKHDFGKPPHCMIIPGKMHPIEEDMLKFWNDRSKL